MTGQWFFAVSILCGLGMTAAPLHAEARNWDELTQAGQRALKEKRFAEAERHFKAALKEAERGRAKGVRLAASLDNLAEVYRAEKQLGKSEKLYRQALTIWERVLKGADPKLAQSVENLADVLTEQGKSKEGEALYQRSREIREKALAVHPEIYLDGRPKPIQKAP